MVRPTARSLETDRLICSLVATVDFEWSFKLAKEVCSSCAPKCILANPSLDWSVVIGNGEHPGKKEMHRLCFTFSCFERSSERRVIRTQVAWLVLALAKSLHRTAIVPGPVTSARTLSCEMVLVRNATGTSQDGTRGSPVFLSRSEYQT